MKSKGKDHIDGNLLIEKSVNSMKGNFRKKSFILTTSKDYFHFYILSNPVYTEFYIVVVIILCFSQYYVKSVVKSVSAF